MLKIVSLLLIVFVFSNSAFSAVPSYVYITGTLVSKTEKLATIKTDKGNVKVPPNSILEKRMELGKQQVKARVSLEALVALN